MEQIGIENITVNFDSIVITRYGGQQDSTKGYNPNKCGRNSHHTLMAFISQTRMVANAWLRPGNTATISSCIEFMQETFDRCLASKTIGLVRADSCFYSEDILNYLKKRRKKLYYSCSNISQYQI